MLLKIIDRCTVTSKIICVISYLRKLKHYINMFPYFSGEEYVKSLTANPELIDRLACLSEEGVCFILFYF
jgi:hypothetical protein